MHTIASSNQLYDDILAIASDYLGPAAKRFVDRQIASHLNKPPEKITHTDIRKLADWSRVAIALLTDDKKIVDDYTANLMSLAEKK